MQRWTVNETTPELSESQRKYWEQQLIYAEKAVEVAKKMLGILAVKETIDGHE